MIWLVTLMLASTPGAAPTATAGSPPIPAALRISAEALLAADTRRIRAANGRVATLVTQGVRRSRTFAELIVKIHQTNVIVYVESSFGLPPEMAGRLLLQGVAGKERYLRVQVRATLPGDQLISVIAHELRHALEVADDPLVVDEAGLLALYRRIGQVSAGTNSYDTDAARVAGQTVRDELVG